MDYTFNGVDIILGRKVNLPEIRSVVKWAASEPANIYRLLEFAQSSDERTGVNALWSLTHLQKLQPGLLQSSQSKLIDMLLTEKHLGRKRMLLQILREQSYEKETVRSDFLDYCLSKINSECEPYAIRCNSIYCAFKMCRCYPELMSELEEHLELLTLQVLSPGLKSALATTRRHIDNLNKTSRP